MRQNDDNYEFLRSFYVGEIPRKFREDLIAENRILRDAIERKEREVRMKDENTTWLSHRIERIERELEKKDVTINSIKDKHEEEIERLNKEWQEKMDFLRSLFPKS